MNKKKRLFIDEINIQIVVIHREVMKLFVKYDLTGDEYNILQRRMEQESETDLKKFKRLKQRHYRLVTWVNYIKDKPYKPPYE